MVLLLALLATAIIAANTIALVEIIGSRTLPARRKAAWCFTLIAGTGVGSIIWFLGSTRRLHAPAVLILPDGATYSPTLGEISRMHAEISAYVQQSRMP